MFSEFFILFRESLEAALVIGLILAVLAKTGNKGKEKLVYYAVLTGVIASIAFAYGIQALYGEFEGVAEEIFEGTVMILTAILIITTVLWLGKHNPSNMKKSLALKLKNNDKIGLFFLSFFAVFREGAESAVFLLTLKDNLANLSLIGGLLGILAAVLLGYLLFTATLKIELKHFFTLTNIFLIGLAVFFFISGVHELFEAGIFNIVPKI
jgi:high-affinity iron transporter